MKLRWFLWHRRARQVPKEQPTEQDRGDREIIAQIINRLLVVGPADASGEGENPFDDANAAIFEARQIQDCMENGVYFVFSHKLVAGLTRPYHVYVPPHDFRSERRILFL